MMYYPLTTNTINKEDKNLAIGVIKSGNITRGYYNKSVEQYFSKKFNRFALLVNSGSSANLLAFSLLTNNKSSYNLNKGDEVIIPTLCWSTSLYPIIQTGLKPIFVDVDINTLNLDLEKLEKKITKKTKAIMLVHALGNCTNMSLLMKIVKKYNLVLIEDTCEALGSKFKNRYLGSYGSISSFSFYFSHHITSGEGGLILCKNYNDYKILLSLRAHGWSREIDNLERKKSKSFNKLFNFINLGYNLRLTDIQAALLFNQMKKIDKYRKNRLHNYNLIYKIFREDEFLNNNINFIKNYNQAEISWFNFPIILKNLKNKKRDIICEKLYKLGIETRPVISGDFSKQKIIKQKFKGLAISQFTNADKIHTSGFMLGISSKKIDAKIIIRLANDIKKVIKEII